MVNVTEGKEAGCVSFSRLFCSSKLGYGPPIRRHLFRDCLKVREWNTVEVHFIRKPLGEREMD